MASNDRNECMNEIRLLQSMQHPHVIQYLDCVMEDNELRVVMEMAEFGDLARCEADRAEPRAPPPASARPPACPAAQAD